MSVSVSWQVQTLECCKKADGTGHTNVPKVIKGKFESAVNYTMPSGKVKRIPNPTIAYDGCNMMDPKVKTCMELQATRMREGEICLPGSLGTDEAFSLLFFKNTKQNSYVDSGDKDGDGISDDEDRSSKIPKQCVWKEDQLTNGIEQQLGQECKSDTDCETSLGKLGEKVRMLQFGSLSCLCRAWSVLVQIRIVCLGFRTWPGNEYRAYVLAY